VALAIGEGVAVADDQWALDQWMLDALPEAVVVTSDGAVTRVNDRADTLLGLGAAAVGRPLADVLDLRDDAGDRCTVPPEPPRVGDRLAERVLQVVTDGRSRPVAVAGRWRDGALVLTARSAGRREQLDAVHGDVVATVSHEIRSPLASVKGFTRTLLARWDRFSDEQKRTMLETIDADADRVTRLLRDLLDVSRIDAGRVQLHRTRVDLVALTEQVIDRARHHEDANERELTVAAPDALPEALVDQDKLEQVLTNLVENALRYAPEGPVEIELSVVIDRLVITVRDRGPGVAVDQQRLVFQKFGRGRDVRRTGTGLGLYITRGLVEAHGGHVHLDADPRGGACFCVELPFEPVATTATGAG
jgi:signal transduction histidine kinase